MLVYHRSETWRRRTSVAGKCAPCKSQNHAKWPLKRSGVLTLLAAWRAREASDVSIARTCDMASLRSRRTIPSKKRQPARRGSKIFRRTSENAFLTRASVSARQLSMAPKPWRELSGIGIVMRKQAVAKMGAVAKWRSALNVVGNYTTCKSC